MLNTDPAPACTSEQPNDVATNIIWKRCDCACQAYPSECKSNETVPLKTVDENITLLAREKEKETKQNWFEYVSNILVICYVDVNYKKPSQHTTQPHLAMEICFARILPLSQIR